MKYLRAENPARRSILGTRIGLANRWWQRLRGLIGRSELDAGEGLLLRPCRAVHMAWMSFPLDVAFLNSSGEVIATYHALAAGARTGWHTNALDALELPPGTLARTGTENGDTIVYTEVGP